MFPADMKAIGSQENQWPRSGVDFYTPEVHTAEILHHFRMHAAPLELSKAGAVAWDDVDFHRAAYRADPAGYALLALVPGVQERQRARVLLQVLATSRAGLGEEVRGTLDKTTRTAPSTAATTSFQMKNIAC